MTEYNAISDAIPIPETHTSADSVPTHPIEDFDAGERTVRPNGSGSRHDWRHRLFAAWFVLLDGDAAAAYRECYKPRAGQLSNIVGPRLLKLPNITGYIKHINSVVRLTVKPKLSQAEMDTAVLESAYRATQSAGLSPRELAAAVKEYAFLRKSVSMQGVEAPALTAAGSLSDFLDTL